MSNDNCPITGELIQKKFHLQCGHVFEQWAILEWLSSNKNCPLCRQEQIGTFEDPYIKKIKDLINEETYKRHTINVEEMYDFLIIPSIPHTIDIIETDNFKIGDLIAINLHRNKLYPCKIIKETAHYYYANSVFSSIWAQTIKISKLKKRKKLSI